MNFLPKDDVFFKLFINSANNANTCAVLLKDIIQDSSDIEAKAKKVKEIEEECDKNTHDILAQLNKSFVTPLDREDIYLIAKELDEIVDFIEEAAYWFVALGVKEVRSEAIILADLIIKSTRELQEVVQSLKNTKITKELHQKIVEVNRIENEGDGVFRQAVKTLFNQNMDPLEVIKWKEIFEFLENTLDACEDLANTIEGVIMKHA